MPASTEPPLPDPASHRELRRTRRQTRNAAIRGALIASAVMVGVLALRGQGGAWLIIAILAAVAASASMEAVFLSPRPDPTTRLVTPSRRAGIAETLLSQIPDPVRLRQSRSS